MKQQKEKPVTKEEVNQSGLTPRQKNWLYTGIFLVAALIFFIVNNSGDESEPGPYPPGYNSNPVTTLKLSGLKGKVVLVDFWATWCPPCRKGIPDLIEIKDKYAGKDFEIIGVSLDAVTRGGKTKNDVAPFMKEMKINYPVVEGLVSTPDDFGGFKSIPTSFIIDKEGKVIQKYDGLVAKDEYIKIIDAALSGNKKGEKPAPDFELQEIK